MNEQSLLERVRLTYHLSDDAVLAITNLCQKASISTADAVLQLGIISRRQLSDVMDDHRLEPSTEQPKQNVNPRLLQPTEQSAAPLFASGIDTYELGHEIARGGMGRVVNALDKNLERPVAVKLLLNEQQQSSAWQSRFIQEAQVTGQLQHPSIIPVYDLGMTSQGQLYFSMKKVEGITLSDVFKRLRAEDPSTMARFTRSKLIQTFQMVCMAVAYAHSRSVIHRDIKPSNIMVGEFGEVFLMDWGLAKILEKEAEAGQTRVRSMREEQGRMTTRQGQVIGTPGYMAPELALGQLHLVGEESDVYALGAILYELLTLRRPYAGKDVRTIVQRMLRTPVIPASQRTPGRDIPEQLEQITGRCLERDISLRYQSVMDLYRELQGFVENHLGVKSRSQTLVHQLSPTFTEYWDARQQLDELYLRVLSDGETITPWSRLETKREVWQQQRELERLERRVDQLYSAVIQGCEKKLISSEDTRGLVNQIGAAIKAELTPPTSSSRVLESERLIRDFKRWPNLRLGSGRLVIRSNRPEVNIELSQCEEVDGLVKVKGWKPQGQSPVVVNEITPGPYLIRLQDQRLSYIAPIQVPRIGDLTVDVPLSQLAALPEGFIGILSCASMLGGDEQAFWSLSRKSYALESFALSRYPVTFGEYLEFLNALAVYDLEQALGRCPRSESSRLITNVGGEFTLPQHSPFKQPWNPQWPVFGINWHDARAFCDWRSSRDNLSIRLPTSVEWEMAGRGADERKFPWGNIWEPTFCNNALENPGAPTLNPVGSHPTDMSPFGVVDMAGGVAEWTQELQKTDDIAGQVAVCRGGSWSRTDRDARLASRHPMFPDAVSRRIGFRLAISLP
jgi:eukaryotic-like serine/threonine-protein kinase